MFLSSALLALALQTPAPAAASVTLADLVPHGTIAFVQVPSLDRAAQFAQRMLETFQPGGGPPMSGAVLLAMTGLRCDSTAIDATRPIGVCVVLGEQSGGQPMPTVLIPVKDADAFLKSVEQPGAPWKGTAKGGYVSLGLGLAPEIPGVPAAIANGMPAGEVAARLDLGRLIEQYRDQIDEGLNQVESLGSSLPPSAAGVNPAPMMGAYADLLRDFIDSAETLDLAVQLEGDDFELGMKLTNGEGSPFADFGSKEKTGVRAMASKLVPGAGLEMVFGADMPKLLKRFQPMFDVMPAMYPEPMRGMLGPVFQHIGEFYGLLGSAQAISFDFSPAGMRYTAYLDCKDPAKLVELYRTMMKSFPGFEIRELPAREFEGFAIAGFHFDMDLEAMSKSLGQQPLPPEASEQMQTLMKSMFGSEGMSFQVASRDGVTAIVMGGDDEFLHGALARMSSKAEPAPFVAHALREVGDLSPCFVMHYDLGRMLGGMKTVMAAALPGGADQIPDLALSVGAYGGVDGRTWRGALSLSMKELAALAHMRKSPGSSTPTPR
ncbi:MAG: hypothetical protein IPJ19_18275 [Planctomycetes bacterium]|nr:hypothetical protein [Planctomycetota bacterium]